MNKLYYGDCLQVMNDMRLGSVSVDLIYLDPPFNSNRSYNAIYKDSTGRPLPSQVNAFCDMWELTAEREQVLRDMPMLVRDAGVDNATVDFWQHWMNALRYTQPSLLAYLLYMVERLIVMKGLLKPTGSIYLHCDPTASHYIKIMMDGIFGHKNFRREVIWSNEDSSGFKSQAANWIRGHDTIFYYTLGSSPVFNKQYFPLGTKTIKRYDKVDEDGKRYKIYRNKDGTERRSYLKMERGRAISSVWTDCPSFQTVNNTGEYLGYPTQKPLALLKRIIEASCPEGGVVFDPFCGCATTICAAHVLNRKWIGIDIAYHAIRRVVQNRLKDMYHLIENEDYTVDGIPNTLEGARDIWTRDKYQFQRWIVEYIDGFVTSKRSADGGIDGRLYFDNPSEKALQTMALEVKGGQNVNISVVRDLRGAMEREELPMAGLILLEELSDRKKQNFIREMSTAGMIEIHGKQYARMQILTTQEILNGKRFDMPSVAKMSSGQQILV